MEDNKRKLYDALSQDYDLGSFEQFSADIADDAKRRKLYDAAGEEYDFGDFDTFSSQLGFGKASEPVQTAPSAPSEPEGDVPDNFDDEPDLRALNERARKSAEREQRRASKADEAARKASEKAARAEQEARRDMTGRERAKSLNERLRQREAVMAERNPEQFAAEEAERKSAEETKRARLKAENAVRKQTEADVERYGAGNASYSFEEGVSAGREFESIAPELRDFDRRLRDFNEKSELVRSGRLKLTPDESAAMQEEASSLSDIAKRYDAVMQTAPGREYQEISERMEELATGEKTPEAAWEYAQEFASLQRNPVYRATLGGEVPSEDEIQSGLLQGQIAYIEQRMKGAKGDERKTLKKAYSEAKEALYANPYYKGRLEAKIAENQAENAEIARLREARAQEINAQYPGLDMDNRYAMQKTDSEINNFDAASRMHDDAIREYRKPTKYEDYERNVGKGLGDWAKEFGTNTFGIEGFVEDISVVRPVLEKVQALVGNVSEDAIVTEGNIRALEEQLTPGELAVLDAYFEKVGAVAAKGADTAIGYQIGQGIGDMVTLGIEMAATGGVGGAVRKGFEKGSKKALVKVLGKRMYRKMAQSGAGRVALWATAKIPADMVETAVRLPFMPSTYKTLGEKSVELSSDYKVRPLSEYAPDAMWDQYVEQLTEVSNGFAFPLVGKVVKTPGMSKFIKSALGEDGARALRAFMERGDIKLLDDAMIGSFGGEWEEELLGALIHSVTDDPTALRDFFSAEQQLVLLGTLAPIPVSRGTVGGIALGVPSVKADIAWRRVENEMRKAGFDDGRIARLKEVMDNAPVPEAAREIMTAYNDTWEALMAVEDENPSVKGTIDVADKQAGNVYGNLARYFWAAQQKRAVGLMGEIQADEKLAAKRTELTDLLGTFTYERDNGREVVETATMTGADGNPMSVLLLSDPGFDDEVPYVSVDGAQKGFVRPSEDPGFQYGENVDADRYLARLVMQDEAVGEAAQVAGDAMAANESLRRQVEALPEVAFGGKTGSLVRATDDGAVFVPDDNSDNILLTWEELASENGIAVPGIVTDAEKNAAGVSAVAGHLQSQADIADSFNEVLNSTFDEAVVQTDAGPANVLGIIEDTIDPEAGTAQFTVQLPDGSRSVTMSMPIEPVLAQLRGEETAPAEEPAPAPAEEAPVAQEPAEEKPSIPVDKNGNPIYDAPGVSVEDALVDMYSTEGLEDSDVDEYIIGRANETEKGRAVKQGKMSLKEWGQAKKEANRVADFWAQLKDYADENKREREANEQKEAIRQRLIEKYGVDTSKFDLTPQTVREAVAEYLGGDHLISLEDALREIQPRKADGRIPAELLRHMGQHGIITSSGGSPVQDVAADVVREFYGDTEHDDEIDDARNYIIDFVRGYTKREIGEFIFNQRLDQAKEEADQAEAEAERQKQEERKKKAKKEEPKAGPEPVSEPEPVAEPEPETAVEEEVPEDLPEAPVPETEQPEEETAESAENKEENSGKSEEKSVTSQKEGESSAPAESTYGADNKVVSKARYEELRKRFLDKTKGQMNAGFDPELFAIGVEMAAYHIEAGARKFVEFAKNIINDLGDAIRPYLKAIYNGARDLPGMEEIRNDMTPAADVDAMDINADFNTLSDEQGTDSIRDDAGRDSASAPAGDEGGVGEGEGEPDVPADTGTAGEDSEGSGDGNVSGEDSGGGEAGGPEPAGGDTETQDEAPAEGSDGGRGGNADGSRRRGGKRGGADGRKRGGKRSGGTESGETGVAEPGVFDDVREEETPAEDAEKSREEARAEKEKSVAEETDTDKLEGDKDELKDKLSALEESEETAAERERLAGELDAVIARLRELYKTAPKKLESLDKEKVPYVSASDPSGEHCIGSVVPSGVADAMHTAMLRIEREVGKPLAEFVREELGYKTLDEMFTKDGKDMGLAGEQVDACALAIYQMKQGRMFINGDMTGIGKGRVGAALIRWASLHGKKCIFATDKPGLFSDMYRDITDIGSGYKSAKDPGLLPFIINDKDPGNKNQVVTIIDSEKNERVKTPSKAVKSAVFATDGSSLPKVGGSVQREQQGPKGGPQFKGKQYDFVMMTYSQAQSARGAFAKSKLEWLKSYAKDAIIICDESHLAAGQSTRGDYFQDMVKACGGVTFMSATFAKNPQCMALYALRSSMGDARMSNQAFIETVQNYGVPMQEFLAQTLIESGEMVRRERDFTGVETTWTDPKEIYSEEEYEKCRETNDKTVGLIRDIITFQRSFIEPIIEDMNKGIGNMNAEAKQKGEGWFYSYTNTPYSSQVSNICNLMFYAMKAKKAADVAIEKMKKGEKAIIVVDNTLEGYISELEGIVKSPDFTAVFDKGVTNILKYRFNKRWKKLDREESEEQGKEVWVEDKDKAEVTEFDSIRSSFDETTEAAYKNLLQRIKDYAADKALTRLSISPIDYIKELIHEAGFSCGEITGREVQLVKTEDGYKKDKRANERKDTEFRFNGGTAENPLPANEQYDAVILNSAAATGISLHASRRFGNQSKRNMVIVQPAKDQNVEVQVRGRNDRTGQVQRGAYFYITSPIPAEFKTVMMLRKKLASLDAQATGTANVSSNKVDADDMDNKYGDEVAKDFLSEHPEINAQLDSPIEQVKDKKTGEKVWKGRPGLLYQLLIGMQRMTCDEQEMILKSLQDSYIELVEYYEQNGTNELSSSVLNLEAETIDEGVFVHGKDNSSISGFAHDTKLERIESNILKKPMLSSQIYDRMRQLGAINEEGKIDRLYGEKLVASAKQYAAEKKAELEEKDKEELANLIETIREATPIADDQTESQYEEAIQKMTPVLDMKEKHMRDEKANADNLDLQVARVEVATNNLKPGMLVMVPLVDGAPNAVPYGPGRFIGFRTSKDGNPKSVKAVFATKDSRSSIDIPVVKMKDMIVGIVQHTNDSGNLYDQNFMDIGGSRYDARITEEDRRPARDEWWDKRVPKNKGRSIRYIITGNLFQAGFNLGTMKTKDKYGYAQKDENVRGKMCLFTRRDPETGRVTVEQGMLLVDSFDPESFYVSDVVKKPDVWDSGDSIRDKKSSIGVFRSGSNLVIQFYKRKSEKMAKHPVFKDEAIKKLMNEDEFTRTKDYIQCTVPEDKVDEALEHLYKEYGFTKDRLFIMPDSTERVDAIVPDERPYQEIIKEMKQKYPYYDYAYEVENELTRLLARHKADIENEDVINQIRDFVAFRQALYRKDYAKIDTSRLAWQAIMMQDEFEKNTENKQLRDKAFNKLQAIRTEISARLGDKGRLGTLKHYKQGRHTMKEVEGIFKEFNKDKFNKEMADKVFKVFKGLKEANIPVVFSDKIDNGTAGYAQGQLVEYNWKYFNSDWIADQQKANTVLHELVHTLTVYTKYAMDQGYGYLLSDDMRGLVNELAAIFRAIRWDKAFRHDDYLDYGTSDWYEMLAEAASNEVFREDLKKVQLVKTVRDGDASFSVLAEGQDTAGKKIISAYNAVIERLNDLVDSFSETALIEIYRGTGRGEMRYRRGSAENLLNPIDRARAISAVNALARKLGVKFKEDSSLNGKGAFDPKTGQIRINVDAHDGTLDLETTLLHEAVAHYGLRKLLGGRFGEELKTVYDEVAPSVRAKIDAIAEKYGLSTEVATEEYLAQLAEDGRFDAGDESFWQKVWYAIHQLLRKLGLRTHLTDADMRALLYASYRNLQTRGAVAQAHHITVYNALRKQAELSRTEPDDNGPDGDGPGGGVPSGGGTETEGFNDLPEEVRRQAPESDTDELYRFLGEEGAMNLDESGTKSAYLTIAKMMEKNGFDAKRIKMATGWERGADRKWRYEVPDDITIKPGAFDKIIELVDKDEYLNSELLYQNYDMEELFDAPELYKAYPKMRKCKIRILDMKDGGLGSSWSSAIDLNWRMFTSRQRELGYPTILSVITHEVQHEIQRIEGFAYGSWQDDYWSRTGEVEARNAAWRRNMTAEEIAQSLGEETEDVPRSEQSLGARLKVWNAASGKFEDAPMEFREDIKDLETDRETGLLYRRASASSTAITASEMYGDRVRTLGSAVHEVLVDEMHPVDILMDALAGESNSKIKDDERVSDMVRETGGKAMHAIREYNHAFLQPMWSAVGEFRKNTGSSIKDTETYIGLKSGLERNVVLAKRDAKRDYQAQYDAEVAEIDKEEKDRRKKLDKALKDGKISDVTYAGDLTTLQQEIKQKRDDAEMVRKAHFADVDAGTDERFLDNRKKDYSAITAWAETDDLEEAERLAGDYVSEMESRAGANATKEMWKRINAATKETLKFQYEHQVLSKQQYQDVSGMMDYYVPMRGFSEDTAEDLFNYYVTPQSNDFRATVLTAKGRKTWYEGPLGNIGAMHSSAVAQGVKNEAKLSLLDAVRRRPNNTIATVTRAWFVKTGQKDVNGKDIYEVAYPQIPEGATFDERQDIIRQFEEDMAEAKRNGDAYNAHREVDLHGGVVAFERQAHKNEHVVSVREGGKEYGVIINGNPAAAQAINGVRRGNGAGEKMLGILRGWTRFLSSMYTTFSVPFWVSNFQRDHGQGLTNAFIRNNPGYVGAYIKNRIRAAKLFPLILGKETMDKALKRGDPVARMYQQYLENGGPMGQNRIEDNEYFERQMRRYLDNSAKQGVIKAATAVLDVIGGVGEAIETITRFATFMTSMEYGRPIHQSISDAKEISTNFARKGSGRSFSRDEIDRMTHADGTKLSPIEKGFVNAMSIGVEICRATIPFFNAAVQGLENKYSNYTKHFGKTLLADSVYLMLGLGMNLMLSNAGGDDDKEKYSHTSDYLRRNNILMPLLGDGVYSKWALPQEYRVMYALGDILGSAIQQERPADDLAVDAFGALMQMSPWGVVTEEVAFTPEDKKKSYETLITNAVPGVASPVMESIFNMDFKGARIYNEGFNENLRAYPGWTKALPTTGSEYVAAAKWLNEVSGGDDVKRGWININPAVAEHLVESYFSGPYQIVVRLPEAAIKVAKGTATVRDVPLLNRIILNTNDNQRDAYYSNMYYYFKGLNTEAERIHSEYKDRPKEGKVAEFYGSKDYKYMLVFKKYDKAEKELRKASKTMAEKGDEKAKKEYDDRLQDIQYRIARECLDIYFDRVPVK